LYYNDNANKFLYYTGTNWVYLVTGSSSSAGVTSIVAGNAIERNPASGDVTISVIENAINIPIENLTNFPSQTGHAGEYLQTTGTMTQWNEPVTSLNTFTGDVIVTAGTNVTISNVAGVITINSSAAGEGYFISNLEGGDATEVYGGGGVLPIEGGNASSVYGGVAASPLDGGNASSF
jgi:hypothetical protein